MVLFIQKRMEILESIVKKLHVKNLWENHPCRDCLFVGICMNKHWQNAYANCGFLCRYINNIIEFLSTKHRTHFLANFREPVGFTHMIIPTIKASNKSEEYFNQKILGFKND